MQPESNVKNRLSKNQAHSLHADVMQKAEARCLAERRKKRSEILSKKRENLKIYNSARTISLIYCNIRGLNNVKKQLKLIEYIQNEENVDIIQLTETKLSRDFYMKGWKHI